MGKLALQDYTHGKATNCFFIAEDRLRFQHMAFIIHQIFLPVIFRRISVELITLAADSILSTSGRKNSKQQNAIKLV